jgi:hypothetical protein
VSLRMFVLARDFKWLSLACQLYPLIALTG